MATITFTNFLAINPALEDVLDKSPTIGPHDAATLDLINNNGGVANGFVFRLTGTGFTYGGPGGAPDGGTFTDITILDGSANIVATVTGAFSSNSLSVFWTNLQSNAVTLLQTFDFFLQVANTSDGSAGNDHLTAFGGSPNTLSGAAGNDVLRARADADVLIGGIGDDVLRINSSPATLHGPLAIHGSAQDGSGGAGETDILEVKQVNVSFSEITNIDGLRFLSSPTGNLVTLLSDQIGPGLVSPTLAVEEGSFATSNTIWISRSGTAAVDLDLSGWTFIEFDTFVQVVRVDLADDTASPRNDRVIGSSGNDTILTGAGDDLIDLRGGLASIGIAPTQIDNNAVAGAGNDTVFGGINNDYMSGGDGNDVLYGRGGGDELHGDGGDDQLLSGLGEGPTAGRTLLLDGGAGTDFVFFDRSNSARSYALDLGDPSVGSALGDGTTVINVERVEFHAGSGNDTLTGGAFDDLLIGDAGRDLLTGNAGNDTLNGGAGFDILDGGAGTDTATFSGARAAYQITAIGNDFQVVGPDGLDLLTNVELAVFGDAAVVLRQPLATFELLGANGFDYVYYLQQNPDVLAAGIDPLYHFQAIGWKEGRDPNALFDVSGYLATYTDVAAAGINPLDHYHAAGWTEGRDPSTGFDTTSYLAAYPDVGAAHIDPLRHYLQFGMHEGRTAFADGTWG